MANKDFILPKAEFYSKEIVAKILLGIIADWDNSHKHVGDIIQKRSGGLIFYRKLDENEELEK
jgi:hypothetical protein